jgi:predicted PolB exonuclease-like 3'-5' exonuclease
MKDFSDYLKNILFIDIETVSMVEAYPLLPERLKPHWDKKAMYIDQEIPAEDLFFEKAGIYAEFGKIIVIAVGFFYTNKYSEELSFKVKSFASDDEHKILSEFSSLIEEKYQHRKLVLCAHNGKEFDFPYICRRMLVNKLNIPHQLNLVKKKPWEIDHIDTLEMWKFGDRKNYTSLDLLASLFDIPTSKDGIDGSMVNHVYYKEANLSKIAKYCEKDVIVTAQLFLRLNNKELVAEPNIIAADTY